MEWLRWNHVYNDIRDGRHLLDLFHYFGFEGIDTGSKSRGQYTALRMRFENDLLWNANKNRRLLSMDCKPSLDDERGFLRCADCCC